MLEMLFEHFIAINHWDENGSSCEVHACNGQNDIVQLEMTVVYRK